MPALFLDCLTLQEGTDSFPQKSVRKYISTLRKVPKRAQIALSLWSSGDRHFKITHTNLGLKNLAPIKCYDIFLLFVSSVINKLFLYIQTKEVKQFNLMPCTLHLQSLE